METDNRAGNNVITMQQCESLPEYQEGSRLRGCAVGKYGMLRMNQNDCRKPLLLENENTAAAEWSSNCMIDRCYYMEEKNANGGYRISFGARADMQEVCSKLLIRLLVFEQKTGVFRELKTEQAKDTCHLTCDIEWELTGCEADIAEMIPYAEFSWTYPDGEHNACQMSRFQYRLDELLSKYEHAWPIKESEAKVFGPGKPRPVPVYTQTQTPPPFSENDPQSYVLVSLFRGPYDLHDCDYVCYVDKVGSKPHIEVPFLCRLTAAKNWKFRELVKDDIFCMLTNKSSTNGSAKIIAGLGGKYKESGFVLEPSTDRQTATVSLITPWEEHTLQPGDMKKYFYDMDLHLEIVMEERGNPSHTEIAYIDLSSRMQGKTQALRKEEFGLYPVALMWGCLAEDTMIAMADGNSKRIDRMEIGDYVMNPQSKEPLQVTNIWMGYEEHLVMVMMEDGCSVRMTASHPVYQENGFIRAGNLKPGDIVYGKENKKTKIVSVETVLYQSRVYNIDLNCTCGTGVMLANGIVVGDNGVQNSI